MSLTVGTTVTIHRDETRYPSRGSWPSFRGRNGTIVEINRAGKGAPEYGVTFNKHQRADAWFKAHELRAGTWTGPEATA